MDGVMNMQGNPHPGAYDEPNSFNGPAQAPQFKEPPLKLSGGADRWNHRVDEDDYSQPGNLLRLMDAGQQQRLCMNFAEAMRGIPQFIIERQLVHFDKADPKWGKGVREALVKLDQAGAGQDRARTERGGGLTMSAPRKTTRFAPRSGSAWQRAILRLFAAMAAAY
uniref:Catalase immune-responsive domain-containing protein n=1 Tax=mine drainage metagenome TaxID=410659 RepID=E6PV21_9ZZZZ